MYMDRQGKMKDVHLHFTGSLSPDYVYQQLKKKNAAFLNSYDIQSSGELGRVFGGMFTDDYKKNNMVFQNIYTLIQSVTKPYDAKNVRYTYRNATHSLTMNLLNHGITEYTIISGPDNDINGTYERYLGMIEGFQDTEEKHKNAKGQIVITFIRNSEGILKNYSVSLLHDICQMLLEEPFKSRCVGFDISGYEYPRQDLLDSNLEVLSEITDAKNSYNLKTTIGLHAGEIITGTVNDNLYADYFTNLASMNLDNIGHGTYLWSNQHCQNILKLFAGKTRFDICPTSNKFLTPVSNVFKYLSVLKENGIQYTLNRDDPLIFNDWRGYQR